MDTSFSDAVDIVSTLGRILTAEGMEHAASIVRSSESKIDKTGYDNWNGGTDLYTLYLLITPENFAQLGSERESMELGLTEKLKPIIDQFSSDWVSVQIRPRVSGRSDPSRQAGKISEVTRQAIIDYFKVSGTSWSGQMHEHEFLERLYKVKELPSKDYRYKTAYRGYPPAPCS
jgi:AbiJ N-terminal domain 3